MDVLLSPKVIEVTIAPAVTIATGGAGATNLTTTRTASSVTIESSTGLDAVVPQATGTQAGVMAASDKAALDSLGSQVSGHLGATDPHPQYLTQARGDSRYRALGNIPASEVTGTLADIQIPASIARDSEVTSAIAAITPASIGAATSTQGAKADTALQSTSSLDATRLTGTVPIGSIPAQVALAANVEPSGNRMLTPTGTDPGNTATINGFLAWLLQAVRGAQATLSGLGALANKSTIVNSDVAAGAAIALSKLATDPLARANHTGTQLASTISDFASAVTTRLNATSIDALADVVSTSPTVGQVLKWNGTAYVNDVDSTSGGAGATNLTIANRTTTTLDVVSDTGLDATVPSATTALAGLMTSTDKTKLDGIATGATANSPDANLLNRANHTGTQAIITTTFTANNRLAGRSTAGAGVAEEITLGTGLSISAGVLSYANANGTNAGLMSPTDFTKLQGIATGATANSTDAQLRDRATHTGTQAVGTITGLGALATLGAVGTATITDNSVTNAKLAQSPANTLKGNNTGALANALDLTVSQVTAMLDLATTSLRGLLSPADKVKLDSVASGATANSSDSQLRDRSTHTGTQAISTVTGLQAALDAKQAASALLDALVFGFAGATAGQVPQKNGSTITWATVAGGAGGRPLSTSQPVYYVSTTGSDSNNGLTVGTAFLTIQKAVDTLATIDCNGFNPRVVLSPGTYNQTPKTGLQLKNMSGVGQRVTIEGSTSNPTAYKINGTNPTPVFDGRGVVCSSNTLYRFVGVEFGWTGGTIDAYHKYLEVVSPIELENCCIRGSGGQVDGISAFGSTTVKLVGTLQAEGTFRLVFDVNNTLVYIENVGFTGTCTFNDYFYGVGAVILGYGPSATGSFTGRVFNITKGHVETYGSGSLPGSIPGVYN